MAAVEQGLAAQRTFDGITSHPRPAAVEWVNTASLTSGWATANNAGKTKLVAPVDQGPDRLIGRGADESIFGSRFTVNRETEERKQLFAGLGRVKATVTLKNGTDISLILEKATEQGGTVALSPQALAQDTDTSLG
jgi:hypothetical protein